MTTKTDAAKCAEEMLEFIYSNIDGPDWTLNVEEKELAEIITKYFPPSAEDGSGSKEPYVPVSRLEEYLQEKEKLLKYADPDGNTTMILRAQMILLKALIAETTGQHQPENPMLLKGKSLSDWKKWIDNELAPPLTEHVEEPAVKYVMEAFQEAVNVLLSAHKNNE